MPIIQSFRELKTDQRARLEARRRYEGVFVNKLSEALGEAIEAEVWLDHALDAGYLTTKEHLDLTKSWESIGGTLHTMIEKAPSFCGGRKS